MDRTERLYRIDRLLRDRSIVPLAAMLDDLEVSRATLFRDLEYLRERLNAPIEWDAEAGGYRLGEVAPNSPRYALPGLWLNASELHGLLSMHAVLRDIEPGLLARQLTPLGDRLDQLLSAAGHSGAQVRQRIRLSAAGQRIPTPDAFETVAHATLDRRRLSVQHFNRATAVATERELSPQRLVYYRDNWYLDAWCHLREELRSFSIDAFESLDVLDALALEVDEAALAERFDAGYGIFNGPTMRWATIRFTPERSRWAARERWHPQQTGEWLADGSWQLRVPFTDPREIVWDVLRQGAGAEMIEPEDVRARVREQVERMARKYLQPER